MSIKHFACVCVFAVAAAWPGASSAGSLHGSLDGYFSVWGTVFSMDDDGNIIETDFDSGSSPTTLTFEIEPRGDGSYTGSFSFGGYEFYAQSGGSPFFIHYSQPGSHGATAGGEGSFNGHESSFAGSFEIFDPTGSYIDSGGTADPVGVSANASGSGSGYDGGENFGEWYWMEFSARSPEPPAPASVPEPSSLLLFLVGCPGLAFWGRRRLLP
jgi:hypothetical protein